MDEEQKSSAESNSHSRSLASNKANSSSVSSSSSSKDANNDPTASMSSQEKEVYHNQFDPNRQTNYDKEGKSYWDCHLCTYRNASDALKCEICDMIRIVPKVNTSTRKPRCNANTIVAQVVKQQEQIRQQTKTPRTPKSRSSTSTGNNTATSSSTVTKPKQQQPQQQKSSKPKAVSDELSSSDSSSDETSIYESSSDSSSSPSSSAASAVSSSKPIDNPFMITPLEVNGNLIKYSPPTSSGRTGLIIDKKRFTQHSVTVNDVTITFTEFATRKNRYIRKKKKRREYRSKTLGSSKN